MKLFASDPLYQQTFEEVNRDEGIIRGVKVCSEGPARGHGVFLNKDFIRGVAREGRSQKVGVKARFGHPNMCSTALGTYIGRYKNYRTVEVPDEAFEDLYYKGEPKRTGMRLHTIADLHLDETAKNLPKLGNAWDYVLSMAENNPDMFGNSIVFRPGEDKIHRWKDDQGVEQQRRDATLEALLATDLVDNPAATEGLFEQFGEDELVLQVTSFLDQNPRIYDLAVNHPDVVESFLNKYQEYKHQKQSEMETTQQTENKGLTALFEDLKSFIADTFRKGEEAEPEIPAEVTERLNAFDTLLNDLPEAPEIPEEMQTAVEDLAAANERISELEGQISEFSSRVLELEGRITKENAKGTAVAGLEGAEDPDENLSEEKKMLLADLKKLRGEFDTPHE